MKFQSFLLLLFGVFAPVIAAAEYWISVASFKNRDSAESALVNAQVKSEQAFAVYGARTDKGYFFRVMAGPYPTIREAKRAQQSLSSNGLNAGWIWGDGPQSSSPGVSNLNEASSLSEAQLPGGLSGFETSSSDSEWDRDWNDEWDDEFDFDENLDFGTEDTLTPENSAPIQKALPQIQETAPEGYQLNKLRREARAPPLEHLNLAVSLNQTRPKLPPNSESEEKNQSKDAVPTYSPDNIVEFSLDMPVALPRRESAPEGFAVDGLLDENIWAALPGADNFLVDDPDTLAKPAYRTVVKAFYTQKGLYVGIDMEQPAKTLVRRLSGRDMYVRRDRVGVTLDTSGEGRYGYWINVALGGSQSDGTLLPERQFSRDWDGAWYSGTAVTESGWSAEFFLPWSQVAMPQNPGQRTIKAYISRKVAHLDEDWSLPALPRTQPLFMSRMQPITLQRVAPVQNWSVFPYVSSTYDFVEGDTSQKIGADLFWRPSTNFQATAALKPDFGSVESDDVVVNLGAFETFFPEKRLFFQEGIEVFTATPRAEGGNPTTLLNTRRIGGIGREPELPDGTELSDLERQKPVELEGALKTVGSIGPVRYGILGAFEDQTGYEAGGQRFMQAGTDYGVARALYEGKTKDGDYRALGFLSALTSHPDQETQAHGVDYHYLTAQGEWKVDGQFLFSSADGRRDGFGGFVDIGRDFGKGRRIRLGYSHYDEYLDINDLGFLRRNDLRGANGRYEINRSTSKRYRKSYVGYWFRLERNSIGEYVRKAIGIDSEVVLLNQSKIELGAAFFPSRDEDFDSRGNGTYRLGDRSRFRARYQTDRAKPFSYEINLYREDEQLSGAQFATGVGANWRPRDDLNLGIGIGFIDRAGWLLWREGINFATYRAREWRPEFSFEYFPDANHQIKLSTQWVGIRAKRLANYQLQVDGAPLVAVDDSVASSEDFAISNLSLQLRYRWQIAPLSDLFVVYTLNGRQDVVRDSFDNLFTDAFNDPLAEQLTIKLRYRFGS